MKKGDRLPQGQCCGQGFLADLGQRLTLLSCNRPEGHPGLCGWRDFETLDEVIAAAKVLSEKLRQ